MFQAAKSLIQLLKGSQCLKEVIIHNHSSSQTRIHMHMLTYTHAHTKTHTHTYTHKYTHKHTCTQTHTHVQREKERPTYTHSDTQSFVHSSSYMVLKCHPTGQKHQCKESGDNNVVQCMLVTFSHQSSSLHLVNHPGAQYVDTTPPQRHPSFHPSINQPCSNLQEVILFGNRNKTVHMLSKLKF